MTDLGKKWMYLGLLGFVQILGIALFCKGFFPYKVYLSGHATHDDLPSSVIEIHNQQDPEFDRLVFVLVDALRNDFLFGPDSGFDFVKSQIQQGAAYPFTAKATAPTVTLPRVKALTTGTVPSFLDAILNIAESDTSSSLNKHDNWLYQFKNNGNKTVHFFGDDTWIRLFPDLFDKTDGTTSFFVSDTTEVDHNVTRHINSDLRENDWDAVILHYLGLDHIGHLGGPESPLMKPKQKEMDQAIESIYDIVAEQDAKRIMNDPKARGTLIVVCGDHGMNEKGNHGGSSVGETSAALAFLSPRFESRPFKYQKPLLNINRSTVLGHPMIDQIDIVPTLAALFAFPIPKNNLGKIIFELLNSQSDTVLHGLLLNASQLGRLLSRTMPGIVKYMNEPLSHLNCSNDDNTLLGCYYAQAVALHQKYLAADSQQKEQFARDSGELYYKFIEIAQSHMANTATDYSLNLMVAGVLFISISGIGFAYWSTYQTCSSYWNVSKYFCIIAVGIYSASMFASSFVEEEHTTWYGFLQTITLLSVIHSFRIPHQSIQKQIYPASLCFVQLILVRIAIAWNHGGLSEKVLSYSGVQWHLMVLTLFTTVIASIKTMQKLIQKQSIDVNHTAKIIQTMIRSSLALITLLTSVLVLAYKMRAYSSTTVLVDHIPTMYADVLDWELVKSLNQVQLGRLIYNYGGAALFVLFGLIYVTKRAALMNLDSTNDEESKTGVILQILLYSLTPILVLLSGTDNAVLFFIFHLQFQLLLRWQNYLEDNGPIPVWLISMIIACLSHASFFLTGHTNSIASADLSNAYVGVQEYDTILIGLLTFCSNWSGSIWWAVAGWALIADHRKREKRWTCSQKLSHHDWLDHLVVQSALFSLVLTMLSISVTVLREHLFIWTVFSPKYLYQIAWICLYHWLFQVVIGSLVTYLISKEVLASTLEQDQSDDGDLDDDDELELSPEDEIDLDTKEEDA